MFTYIFSINYQIVNAVRQGYVLWTCAVHVCHFGPHLHTVEDGRLSWPGQQCISDDCVCIAGSAAKAGVGAGVRHS